MVVGRCCALSTLTALANWRTHTVPCNKEVTCTYFTLRSVLRTELMINCPLQYSVFACLFIIVTTDTTRTISHSTLQRSRGSAWLSGTGFLGSHRDAPTAAQSRKTTTMARPGQAFAPEQGSSRLYSTASNTSCCDAVTFDHICQPIIAHDDAG